MAVKKRIILGSSSPYRLRILRTAGILCEAAASDFDEKSLRSDDAFELTLMLAFAKRDALLERFRDIGELVLVTADQVVTVNGSIREKPRNSDEARQWLASYGDSGPVRFVTSVAASLVRRGEVVKDGFVIDTVTAVLNPFVPAEIDALVRNGRVLKVAGALCIEEPLVFHNILSMVNAMEDPVDAKTSAMGLPVVQTATLLRQLGAID